MVEIKFYGLIWNKDSRRLKAYLDAHEVDFNYIDFESEEADLTIFLNPEESRTIIPAIVYNNKIYHNPSNLEVKQILQIKEKSLSDQRGFTCGIERPSWEIGDECEY